MVRAVSTVLFSLLVLLVGTLHAAGPARLSLLASALATRDSRPAPAETATPVPVSAIEPMPLLPEFSVACPEWTPSDGDRRARVMLMRTFAEEADRLRVRVMLDRARLLSGDAALRAAAEIDGAALMPVDFSRLSALSVPAVR